MYNSLDGHLQVVQVACGSLDGHLHKHVVVCGSLDGNLQVVQVTCKSLEVRIFFRKHADIQFKQGAAAPCFYKFIRRITVGCSLIIHFCPEQ